MRITQGSEVGGGWGGRGEEKKREGEEEADRVSFAGWFS